MYDICFFRDCEDLKKKIVSGNSILNKKEIFEAFEGLRSRRPFVFNIETTNICNMKCQMCPRTNLMSRKLQSMTLELFENIIKQIKPYEQVDMDGFWKYIVDSYSIHSSQRSEDAFYFYTISQSVVLHGYGEPLLDPYLLDRIRICAKYKVPTYFSCVPANINVEKITELMKAGAGVIKFSMDALDDESARTIRGKQNNFTEAYDKICQLIEVKRKDLSIKTTLVVSMIALSDSKEARMLHENFMKLWENKAVYAYVKSQDNRWYFEDDQEMECKSHYEKQYCEFPFTSLSIMVDGSVVPCTQDYNVEMSFGNVNEKSLEEIWNSQAYKEFRWGHVSGEFDGGIRCVDRCDQKLVVDRLNKAKNEVVR